MTVQEKLLRSGKGCSASAFAVFDTLLRRDASTPAALFALSDFSGDFALRRIRAEQVFLARDMELVFRVYHRLFPQDTCSGYLRVSRRCWRQSCLSWPLMRCPARC